MIRFTGFCSGFPLHSHQVKILMKDSCKWVKVTLSVLSLSSLLQLYIICIPSVSCPLVLIWVNWSIGTFNQWRVFNCFNTPIISIKSLQPFKNSPITKIMISRTFCPRVISAHSIVLKLRALKLNHKRVTHKRGFTSCDLQIFHLCIQLCFYNENICCDQ